MPLLSLTINTLTRNDPHTIIEKSPKDIFMATLKSSSNKMINIQNCDSTTSDKEVKVMGKNFERSTLIDVEPNQIKKDNISTKLNKIQPCFDGKVNRINTSSCSKSKGPKIPESVKIGPLNTGEESRRIKPKGPRQTKSSELFTSCVNSNEDSNSDSFKIAKSSTISPIFNKPLPNLPSNSGSSMLSSNKSINRLKECKRFSLQKAFSDTFKREEKAGIQSPVKMTNDRHSFPALRQKPSGPRKIVVDNTFLPETGSFTTETDSVKLSPSSSIENYIEPLQKSASSPTSESYRKRNKYKLVRPRTMVEISNIDNNNTWQTSYHSDSNNADMTLSEHPMDLFSTIVSSIFQGSSVLDDPASGRLLERFFGPEDEVVVSKTPALVLPDSHSVSDTLNEPMALSHRSHSYDLPRQKQVQLDSKPGSTKLPQQSRDSHQLSHSNSCPSSDSKAGLFLLKAEVLGDKLKPVTLPSLKKHMNNRPVSNFISKVKARKGLTNLTALNESEPEARLQRIVEGLDFTDRMASLQLDELKDTPWFMKTNRSCEDLSALDTFARNHDADYELSPTPSCKSSEFNISPVLGPNLKENPKAITVRYHIAMEIASTEESYLAHLRRTLTLFREPLITGNTTVIPSQAIADIFGHFDGLIKLSADINCALSKLTAKGQWDHHSTCVGQLFLDRRLKLRVYLPYIRSYLKSVNTLEHWENESKQFQEILAKGAQANPARQSLKEMMILPIQRLTRYSLLLQTLRQNTPSIHPDYAPLGLAVDMMTSVAIEANDARRNEEQKATAQAIFASVDNCPTMLRNPGFERVFLTEALDLCTRRRIRLFVYPTFIMLAVSRKLWSIYHNKWKFLKLIPLEQLNLVEVFDGDNASNICVLIANQSDRSPISHNSSMTAVGSDDEEVPSTKKLGTYTKPSHNRSRSNLTPSTSTTNSILRSGVKSNSNQISKFFILQQLDHRSHIEFIHILKSHLKTLNSTFSSGLSNYQEFVNINSANSISDMELDKLEKQHTSLTQKKASMFGRKVKLNFVSNPSTTTS